MQLLKRIGCLKGKMIRDTLLRRGENVFLKISDDFFKKLPKLYSVNDEDNVLVHI